MFGFQGVINRRRFAIGMTIRFAIFIAITVVFPFALIAYGNATQCQRVSGACGVVGIIFAMTYKPLAFIVFFVSLPGILNKRLRDIGLSPWWSLFLLLLMAADSQFLIFAGAPWSFGFSNGVLGLAPPVNLLLAIAFFIVLAILPSRPGRIGLVALGWPAILCIGLSALIGLLALLTLARSIQPLTIPLMQLTHGIQPLYDLQRLDPFLMAALVPASLLMIWPRPGERLETPLPRTRDLVTPQALLTLMAIALLVTIAVFVIGLPHNLRDPFFLPSIIVSAGLPTFALYLALLVALYLLAWRRSWIGLVMLVLAAAVFGSWGYEHWQAIRTPVDDAKAVAATPVVPLPNDRPRAVLVDDTTRDFVWLLLQRADIDVVYLQKTKTSYVQYVRGGPKQPQPAPNGLPARYFELNDRAADIALPRVAYAFDSPYALRLEDNGTDSLVAVWFQRQSAPPLNLPILAPSGWMGGTVVTTDDIRASKARFLLAALGPAPAASPPVPNTTATDCAASGQRSTLFAHLFCNGAPPGPTPKM